MLFRSVLVFSSVVALVSASPVSLREASSAAPAGPFDFFDQFKPTTPDTTVEEGNKFVNILGQWRDKISGAIKNTIDDETKSVANAVEGVKGAVKDAATATVDVAKAGWDVATIIPRVGISILTRNDTSDLAVAIRLPIEQSKDSLSKAIDSVKDAASNAAVAGVLIVKSGFDLGFVVPKFGAHLFNGTAEKLESALERTYEQEKLSINQAVDAVKTAGEYISQVGSEVRSTTVELAKVLPQISAYDLTNEEDSEQDEELKQKMKLVEERITKTVNLIIEASDKLSQAGEGVAKAGLDLGLVIPKYSLNLLSDEDRQNVETALQTQVQEVRESIKNAVAAIQGAAEKIRDATKDVFQVTVDISSVGTEMGKEFYEKHGGEIQASLEEAFDNIKRLTNKTIHKMKIAGERITEAGKSLAKAGWALVTAIPKFGISILTGEKETFDQNAIDVFEKLKNSMLGALDSIKQAGEKFIGAGNGVKKTHMQLKESFGNSVLSLYDDVQA